MAQETEQDAAQRAAEARYRPFDEPMRSDPYPAFAELRRTARVFHAPEIDHWVVTRYDDVKQVFTDVESFSAANTIQPIHPLSPGAQRVLAEGEWRLVPALGNNDPPDHARFRKNVNKAFTPRRIAVFEPFVRERVNEVVDRIEPRGRADIMGELVWDLPALVILELLGLSRDYVDTVREGARNRVRFVWGKPTPEEQEQLASAMVGFWHDLRALVDERLAEPREDLTSGLLEVRGGDDEVLSLDEITSVLFAFLTAGHETTSSLLGNALRQLLGHRDQWEALCADPSLIPGAVEEVLRHDSSVVAWRRLARHDVEVGGVTIPAGGQVLLLLGSANRDEDHFAEPERFDIRREDAGGHISFGHGIHFCLGAALARLEARATLEVLTERLPGLRLDGEQEPEFIPNVAFRGPLELQVAWD